MKKTLFIISCLVLANQAFAGGYAEKYRDPKTGMIDHDRIMRENPVPRDYVGMTDYKEVKSIRQDNDNQVTITMGDGSKKVYERDVFHPEKGWRRTF